MRKLQYLYNYMPVTALSFCISAASTSVIGQEAEKPNSDGSWIDTVVVIGEKTKRSLRETTSSVSVITDEQLRTMQHQTIRDAISDVANVVTLTGSVPDIRGVRGNGGAGGFNSITGGAKARISTLMDGVAEPFVADLTGDSGIWDIEQIEVYRGPQSTSNGRNSIGGSIYIKTADPSFDWEGAGRVGYRSKDKYVDTSVMLSGPISEDRLAFRLTAQRLDAQTITDDTGFAGNPAHYDLNERETNRLRAKLLWQLSDDTRLLLTHSSNNEQGDTGRRYYSAEDPWAFKRVSFRDIETDSETTSLRLDSRINDGLLLDVLLAYMDYEWGFDSYEANPAAQQQLQFDQDSFTLDAKLHFGRNSDQLDGFIGLAYFERDQELFSEGSTVYSGDDESDSKAIYGEVDYALNEDLNIIVGGRLERENQQRNFDYIRRLRGVPGPGSNVFADLDTDKTIFLPKLALQYQLNELTTLALSARQGYNSPGGALNYFAGEYYYYDEETVDSYELSLRSGSADGRFSVTTNIFYNDYDGYQALNSARSIINIGRAVTYGAELEAILRPIESLELRVGLGLLDTEIKDGGEDYAEVTGNELSTAPDLNANLALKYWLNDALSIGASLRYIDEYHGDVENTSERTAGNYTTARFNIDYELDQWYFAAFINNAFDKEAFTTREPAGRFDAYVGVVEPRNVGISATYTF